MRRSWAAVTVGALALVVLAGTFAIFTYTGDSVGRKGYHVHAFLSDALGIENDTLVRSAGIPIGKIVEKEFDSGRKKAKIVMRIDPKVVLWKNALVQKRAASLLGEFYLSIDPGTPKEPKTGEAVPQLKDGDEITNVFEGAEIADITNQVSNILPIMREILIDIREVTSGPIKDIAEQTNQLIATNSVVLERLLKRVDNIAADIEGITRSESDDIRIAITNIREITEGIKSLVGKSEGEVTATGQELRSSVQKLQSSIDKLDKSMSNVEKITTGLQEGEGTAGKLLKDESIANNIEEITEDAGGFVRSLTRLQTVVGLRTEYSYLARQFKSYVSLQLWPRPDKFYLIEVVDDFRGYRRTTSTATASSDRSFVTSTEIKTTDDLRFSLMFGKRGVLGLPWLTGRFGIKESTGGVGLDFTFLDDRFSVSADMFDTRANQYPRLQFRSAFAVYNRNLYVLGGVDDVLNQDPALGSGGNFFDWFLGMALVFRDEDLKSLLLFGGSAVGGASQR